MGRVQLKTRLAQRRGTGEGPSYRPWYQVHELPSLGLSSRVLGWKTGREHHLLSEIERMVFLVWEWSLHVIDIREQFPLPLESTLAICRRAGVRHRPDDLYTTDQLLTVTDGRITSLRAIAVKRSTDLVKASVRTSLEIERRHWASVGVPWRLVTELEVPDVLWRNVDWVHEYRDPRKVDELGQAVVHAIRTRLLADRSLASAPLSDLTTSCDEAFGLEIGSSLMAVRHLIAHRRLPVAMNERLLLATDPLPLLATHMREVA